MLITEKDKEFDDYVRSRALARATDRLAKDDVPVKDRNRLVTFVIQHEGRKIGAGTIAAMLTQGASKSQSAVNTATDIALGRIPMELDVLGAVYPGSQALFKKAYMIWQNLAVAGIG